MDLTTALLFYVVLLVSLVVHEASHATFALLGGDRTAYAGGQVTLNPVPHIRREPFGTVFLPLIMLFVSKGAWCMGYASTPIDALWARFHPRRAALMSAAGPLANLALAALAFLILKLLISMGHVIPKHGFYFALLAEPADRADSGPLFAACRILSVFVSLNLLLAVFNLYPLPPLDGAGVVEGLLPRTSGLFDFLRSQPMLMIGGLIVVWYTLPDLAWPVLDQVQRWL